VEVTQSAMPRYSNFEDDYSSCSSSSSISGPRRRHKSSHKLSRDHSHGHNSNRRRDDIVPRERGPHQMTAVVAIMATTLVLTIGGAAGAGYWFLTRKSVPEKLFDQVGQMMSHKK